MVSSVEGKERERERERKKSDGVSEEDGLEQLKEGIMTVVRSAEKAMRFLEGPMTGGAESLPSGKVS